MELGFLLSIPGITLLVLGWALFAWWRNRRFLRRAEAYRCCLCQTPFAEAQIEVLGPLSAAEMAKLDRFQARFARFRLKCHECGAVNLCTKDGIPMKALPET